MNRRRGVFTVHGVVVGRWAKEEFPPHTTRVPRMFDEDLERIREKHEDSDFGMSLGDELERNNEADPDD